MKQIIKTLKLIFQSIRDLIIRFLPKKIVKFLVREEGEFAFLIHPRDLSDVQRKYPFARVLPNWFLELFTRFLWPVVCSQITGLRRKEGQEVKGWIVGCPLTAKQMMKNRGLAKKRILQTTILAEKLGAKIIGLGALCASLTKGGLDLVGKVKAGLTTGNAYTIAVAVDDIREIIQKRGMSPDSTIAIVGATGSIGQAVSRILAKNSSSLILVGRTPEHLKTLAEDLRGIRNGIKLMISTNVKDIKTADFIIVATSASGAIIRSEHLRKGAVVYDITQPQNVSREVIQERKDVLVIDGGLVKTPGVNFHFNFGIPRETTFACLAETMLLALEARFDHYSLDKIKIKQVEEIKQLGKKYNFYSQLVLK